MDKQARATILIVDSAADERVAITELLQDRYDVLQACSGAEALGMTRPSCPQLLLLPVSRPDMDGFAVLRELRGNFLAADMAAIFLTADAEEDRRALREGAAEIVRLPFCSEVLAARVASQLQAVALRRALSDQDAHIEQLVASRTRAATQMQDATVLAVATLAEWRDPDIRHHVRRTQLYVLAMARTLRFDARFATALSEENIALLLRAAPLHDIGMVGVPDAILLNPGRLTEREMTLVKHHTVFGRDALAEVVRTLGAGTQFLHYASEIAYAHHEKWDGSGYPQGLAGTAIPLSARLMALADVYDALITKRSYRPAFTHETAVELIRQGRGEHFDPDVVDAMLTVENRFKEIAAEYCNA